MSAPAGGDATGDPVSYVPTSPWGSMDEAAAPDADVAVGISMGGGARVGVAVAVGVTVGAGGVAVVQATMCTTAVTVWRECL